MNTQHRRLGVAAIIVAVFSAAVGCGDGRPSKTLHKAVLTRDLAQIERHIHWNSDLNARDELGFSALDYAATKGLVNIAELLIEHGAHPDEPGEATNPYRGIDTVNTFVFHQISNCRFDERDG